MSHFPLVILAIAAFFIAAVPADDYEPPNVQSSDFAKLLSESPFNRTLNLSDSLIITGLAIIDDQQVVTLLNTATKESYLVSGVPNKQGWKMLEVKPDEDLERVTAKISMAGEVVNIRYAEVKLKPGESRPGGGAGRSESEGGSGPPRGGPPEDIRKQVGSLSDEQRGKFFEKIRQMREKNPDLPADQHQEFARKTLAKMAKKNK